MHFLATIHGQTRENNTLYHILTKNESKSSQFKNLTACENKHTNMECIYFLKRPSNNIHKYLINFIAFR